jgi:hypothetical protein
MQAQGLRGMRKKPAKGVDGTAVLLECAASRWSTYSGGLIQPQRGKQLSISHVSL